MLKTKTEVREISNRKTEFDLCGLKCKYFEAGDRAVRVSAHRLQKAKTLCLIPAVLSKRGETLTTPKTISERFKEFYETLYTSEVVL